MSIKHFIRLIPSRFNWFFKFIAKTKMAYKRIKTVIILQNVRKKLEERKLKFERINNDGSLKEAFGIQKQVELIDFLLGGRNEL